MTMYIALLRAVNVGGTGKLPMAELKKMAVALGFEEVRTYIASGNLVFSSDLDETKVKAALEKKLRAYTGKPINVAIRTAAELEVVLAKNPFANKETKFTVAIFLDHAPAKDAHKAVTGQSNEELALGRREIYVHYGGGMGRSKLKIPAAKDGTARNMNTIAKLSAMAIET